MAQADFAQSQTAQDNGQGLRAGVARLPGHDRQQDGQGGELGNGGLEQADHRGGHKGGQQVDLEPRQALADGKADGRQGAFVLAGTGDADQIGGQFGFNCRHQLGQPNTANRLGVVVDHGNIRQLVIFQGSDDLFPRCECRHGRRRTRNQGGQQAVRFGQHDLVQRNGP